MILYLTYNDQPSGVYWSQVTDVVEHLNTLGAGKVKLFALVSGRGFLKTRHAIKAHSPSAWVLPMVPTMNRWKHNTALLAWVCRLLKPSGIICRGPFATWMALRMRDRGLTKKVCFDGRGAYAAEWEEYRIINDDALIAQFRPLENEAVNKSDFRLAVSNALVSHWRERYDYKGDAHVVVPCTLGKDVATPPHTNVTSSNAEGMGRSAQSDRGVETSHLTRPTPHLSEAPVRLVYSGSTAGWQSFELLNGLLRQALDAQPNVHVLFLSKRDANNSALEAAYPGRVVVKWLDHAQVAKALATCDHGIMVRERTITNQVASPTKFAEYLSNGLKVISNNGVGDFSELIRSEGLGVVLGENDLLPMLAPVPAEERTRLMKFAHARFRKETYDAQYRRLLGPLGDRQP